jgi:hypothetical protein
MTMALPELLDAKALQAELGVTRAVAEKVMRRLPVVEFPDIRKVYVRRADLAVYIDSCTSPGEWVFVKGPAARGVVSPAPSGSPTRRVVSLPSPAPEGGVTDAS